MTFKKIKVREFINCGKAADDFLDQILPKNATDAQRRDMKNAFMCGCFHYHQIATQVITQLPDEAGETILTAIDIELKAFRQSAYEKASDA